MSKILIQNTIYDVRLNRHFIKPLFYINGITTDIGVWDNDSSDEQDKLLELAVKCYEYNKRNNSLIYSDLHIHKSEKVIGEKKKSNWFNLTFIKKWICLMKQ